MKGFIHPAIKGRDIEYVESGKITGYLIAIPEGFSLQYTDEYNAEDWFKSNFTDVYNYMLSSDYKTIKGVGVRERTGSGDFWWELPKNRLTNWFFDEILIFPTVSKKFNVKTCPHGVLPIAPLICINTKNNVLKQFLSSDLFCSIYDIFYATSGVGESKNKSIQALKEVFVDSDLFSKSSISDKDIQNMYGLTDEEVSYLLSL